MKSLNKFGRDTNKFTDTRKITFELCAQAVSSHRLSSHLRAPLVRMITLRSILQAEYEVRGDGDGTVAVVMGCLNFALKIECKI